MANPDPPNEPERRSDAIVLSPLGKDNKAEGDIILTDTGPEIVGPDGRQYPVNSREGMEIRMRLAGFTNTEVINVNDPRGKTSLEDGGDHGLSRDGLVGNQNLVDLSKPIKDSYNEFISGEKEFSRYDYVHYIQSIASETYKEKGVVDFVKDVANTLTFDYLKKETLLMLPKSQAAQKGLTLLGSYRDSDSLIEHVSAYVGSEMDTIKGVMRQEMIVQTEKLLETNKKYYEAEKKAIKAEQYKLDQEMKIYKASNDPKQLALIKPMQIRMTELTLRDLKITSLLKTAANN